MIHLRPAQHLGQRLLALGSFELLEDMGAILPLTAEKSEQNSDGRQAARNGARSFAQARLVLKIEAKIVRGCGKKVLALKGKMSLEVFQIPAISVN